jgi:hypothetical protein
MCCLKGFTVQFCKGEPIDRQLLVLIQKTGHSRVTKRGIIESVKGLQGKAQYYFCLSLYSVGVSPVNFLKTVLKVVLELNPASNPTERIV